MGGRNVIAHYLNVSDFIKAPTTGEEHQVEFFRISTYVTSAGGSGLTFNVAERDELTNGDQLYVGTANGGLHVTIQTVTGAGPGAVTIEDPGSTFTWVQYDSVLVKRKNGAGADSYAAVHYDPDYSNEVSQPITLNSDSEERFFMPPQRCGVRIGDDAATPVTVELDHLVEFGSSVRSVYRDQADDLALAIEGEIDRLPSTGGVIRIPEGTFDFDGNVAWSAAGVTIEGAGAGRTVINLTTSNHAFTVTGDKPTIRGMTLKPTTTGQQRILSFGAGASDWLVEDVEVLTNGLTLSSTTVLHSAQERPRGPIGLSVIGGGSGSFSVGVQVSGSSGGCSITGLHIEDCTTCVNIGSGADGVFVAGNSFLRATTGVAVAASVTGCFVGPNHYDTVTTKVSNGGATTGCLIYDEDSLVVDGDIEADGGYRATITGWYQATVAASQTDIEMVRNGISPKWVGRFCPTRAGSIVGISVRSDNARTDGTLTVEVWKSTTVDGAGAGVGLTTGLNAINTTKAAATQAKDTDTFAANDEIFIAITTDGDWLPTTANVACSIQIEQ